MCTRQLRQRKPGPHTNYNSGQRRYRAIDATTTPPGRVVRAERRLAVFNVGGLLPTHFDSGSKGTPAGYPGSVSRPSRRRTEAARGPAEVCDWIAARSARPIPAARVRRAGLDGRSRTATRPTTQGNAEIRARRCGTSPDSPQVSTTRGSRSDQGRVRVHRQGLRCRWRTRRSVCTRRPRRSRRC